jgi:hypothetical protein
MTVIAAATLTLKPGTYPAFFEQHGKTKAVLERLGARNIRLMGTMSGDAGGALAVSMEFDDYASYGKFTDAMVADPEGLKMLTSIGTDENPIVSYQQTVWSVIDA